MTKLVKLYKQDERDRDGGIIIRKYPSTAQATREGIKTNLENISSLAFTAVINENLSEIGINTPISKYKYTENNYRISENFKDKENRVKYYSYFFNNSDDDRIGYHTITVFCGDDKHPYGQADFKRFYNLDDATDYCRKFHDKNEFIGYIIVDKDCNVVYHYTPYENYTDYMRDWL